MIKTYKVPEKFKELFCDSDIIQYSGTNLKLFKLIDLLNYIAMKSGILNKQGIWKYAPIMAEHLKNRYGKYYKKYIDVLIENNFIESSNSYTCGEYSIKYRCTPLYFESDFVDCLIDSKTLNIPKLSINNKTFNYNQYVMLYNDFYRFTIDESVYSWLNTDNGLDTKKTAHIIATLQSIKNNNVYFHVDEHRRLHTNITNLKKYVRSTYLLADNLNTCEIDIKNSQPAILAKLMKNDGYAHSTFISDTISGIVYEKIMAFGKIKHREVAKTLAFTAMFGDGTSKTSNLIFSKLYPDAYEWLTVKRKELNNYKLVSHLIQEKESQFIFDNLLPLFRNTYKNYPFATVHDSIITIKNSHETKLNETAKNLFYDFK